MMNLRDSLRASIAIGWADSAEERLRNGGLDWAGATRAEAMALIEIVREWAAATPASDLTADRSINPLSKEI